MNYVNNLSYYILKVKHFLRLYLLLLINIPIQVDFYNLLNLLMLDGLLIHVYVSKGFRGCPTLSTKYNIPKESCNIVMYILHELVFITCGKSTKYHPNNHWKKILHNNLPIQIKLIYNMTQKLILFFRVSTSVCYSVFCYEIF